MPKVMHTLGRIVRRLQYIRYVFSQQFEDFMQEADLDDIRKQVNFEAKEIDEVEEITAEQAQANQMPQDDVP